MESKLIRKPTLLSLALIGLLFAGFFSLMSPPTKKSEFFWSPANGDQSGRFGLARSWPEELELKARCDRLRGNSEELVFTTGGISLSQVKNELLLSASTPKDSVNLTVELPDENCTVVLYFSSLTGELTLSAGGNSETIFLTGPTFPVVEKLEAGPYKSPPISSVRIVTRPWGVDHTIGRTIVGLVSFFAIVAAIIGLWLRKKRLSNSSFSFRIQSFQQLIALTLILIVAAILAPPTYDDGWVLSRVRNFTTTGVLSNLFDNRDAWLPQGNFHELIIGLLDHLGFGYFWLRIVFVLLMIASWYLIQKLILEDVLKATPVAKWVAVIFFATYSSVWLVSLRAETWVVFFTAISAAGLSRFIRSNSGLSMFFACSGAIFAFGSHQTGWIAVPFAIAAVAIGLLRIRRREANFTELLVAWTTSISIGMLYLFILLSPKMILEGIADFNSDATHSGILFSELNRFNFLFGATPAGYTAGARIASVLILSIFLISAAFGINNKDKTQTSVWGIFAVSSLFLVMTSSKWTNHFGVLAIAGAVFVALALTTDRSEKNQFLPLYTLVLPAVMLINAVASVIPYNWAIGDLTNSTWLEFVEKFGGKNNPGIWVVLILSSAGIAIFADYSWNKKARNFATVATCLAILLLPTLQFGWIGFDSFKSQGWSFPKQNIESLLGRDSCEDQRFVVGLEALPEVPSSTQTGTPLVVGGFPSEKISNQLPVPLSESTRGTWGIQSAKKTLNAIETFRMGASMGEYYSPAYSLERSEFVGIAFATGDVEAVKFQVEFQNQQGRSLERRQIELTEPNKWQIWYLKVPSGALTAQAMVFDKSEKANSWASISSLARAVTLNSFQAQESGSQLVGPGVVLKYECLRFTRPTNGVWGNITYITQDDGPAAPALDPSVGIDRRFCGFGDLYCLPKPIYLTAEVHVMGK